METERFSTPLGLLIVRPRDERDIAAHLKYLYESPRETLEAIGFDPSKFLNRLEMEAHIRRRIHESTKPVAMAAELNGETIGLMFLDLVDMVGPTPKVHFHIFRPELRGQGLGPLIFMAALKGFRATHGHKRFYVEPRTSNTPMNKLMRKLGFKHIKDYVLQAKPMTQEMRVSQYEIELTD